MKKKVLIVSATILMMTFQSTFAWYGGSRWLRVSRGHWFTISNPVTPLPFPIFVPYQRPVTQLQNRRDFSLVAARIENRVGSRAFSNKTVNRRRPKW